MPITHPELVTALKKPGADILRSLTPQKCDLLHGASCIAPEAGELFDAVKKWVYYEKEINRANVVEEIGDIEFYLEMVRQNLGITREETLEANIAKLRERYEKKTGTLAYSNAAAQERQDKLGRDGVKITAELERRPEAGPAWFREAWQAGIISPSIVQPGQLVVQSQSLRLTGNVGQWVVREPWGALSIESNFQPGK